MKKLKLFGVLAASALMMIGAAGAAGSSADKLIEPFVGEHHGKFYSEYATRNDLIKAGSATNLEIAREGMVLLKNKDGMLPLSGVTNVSIFGKNSKSGQGSEKWLRGGGGSGVGHTNGETAVDIEQSLTKVGMTVNPTLKAFYMDDNKSGSGREGTTRYDGVNDLAIGETAVEKYTDDVKASFDQYNDAAFVVLVRSGSEGTDLVTMNARDSRKSGEPTDRHSLQLSKNEQDMIAMVKEKFDKIIILINSGNIFQCDELEADDDIGAILWMGTPGAVGAQAIGEIVTGAVNPSGRTVDTWTRDFTKDPSYQNFADNSQTFVDENGNLYRDSNGEPIPNHTMINADGTPTSTCTEARWVDEDHYVPNRGLNGCYCAAYNNYEEGIYVDYRYHETRYADLLAKEGKAKADEWYDGKEGVIYPFGYGLSYTTFEQSIENFDPAENTVLTGKKKIITVDVKVKNTGDVAGKEVVQLYWKAPYYDGEIEKADHVLCAFGKTEMLDPGDEETLTLSFNLQDFADYDYTDANKNGFKGYELDEGEYEVCLMKNAHEKIDSKKLSVKKGGIQYETDRYTGYKVENRFSEDDFFCSLPMSDSVGFDHMSRHDFVETFPTHPTIEDRTLPAGSKSQEFLTHSFRIEDLDVLHNGYVSEAAYKTKQDFIDNDWHQEPEALERDERTMFADMVGADYDDPRWEKWLNEFTYDELLRFVRRHDNTSLDSIGKPTTSDSDGPNQFEIIWWCGEPTVAATYNIKLAQKQGDIVGAESFFVTVYGWAGPAVNLHRSPFGGRNFEYYSADPFLMGKMSSQVVKGATLKGVYCYYKHFAVNEQEKNREGTMSFVSEQALRMIYLKPFQMCIQDGYSRGIMSSYNRLGMMETAASYPLLVEVLRHEWGFKGAVLSDMTHHGNSSFDGTKYENINNRTLSGCNVQLDQADYGPDMNCKWDATAFDGKGAPTFTYEGKTYESYSWWYAVRQSAKGLIYAHAACIRAQNNVFGLQDQEAITTQDSLKVTLNKDVGEIKFEVADKYAVGQKYNDKSITAVELAIDDVQVDQKLQAGLKFEDGKITGTPTVAGAKDIIIWAKLTLEGDTETTDIATVFTLEVVDPAYDMEETGETGTPDAGLPMAAIIGISVGGGVLVLAGAFCIVWFVVLKKGKKPEAKAAE